MARGWTFVIGTGFTGFICSVLLWFIPFPLNVGAAIAAFSYLGIGGLIQIPIAFRGVPTIFGGRFLRRTMQQIQRRIRRADGTDEVILVDVALAESIFELHEGWNWILPRPIMAAEAVDTREQSAGVDRFTVISTNGVRVTIEAPTIRWRIINPAQSLSVSEEVVQRSLTELIQSGLRGMISVRNDAEAIQTGDIMREELQRRADERSLEWGIDVVEVLIGEISLDPKVQEDYELLRREERQRDGEKVELKHVRERIKELTKMGYSREQALEIVQTERGKVVKNISEFKGNLSPETRDALPAILGAIFGRR